MQTTNIGEVINKAKGNRTYREYQNDSGVDAAVISRIIQGKYIPKKIDIYKKLARAAQNSVTLEEMLDAANSSKEYKTGKIAGAAIAAGAAAIPIFPLAAPLLMGGIVMQGVLENSKNKNNSDELSRLNETEQYLDRFQRFIITTNGILFTEFAKRGVVFQQIVDDNHRIFDNHYDTYFSIDNKIYDELIIRYLYFDTKDSESRENIEKIIKVYLGELLFVKPKKTRKISIVTDSRTAFEYLKRLYDKNSFKGNVTVFLIDINEFNLVAEEMVARFDETIDVDELKIM